MIDRGEEHQARVYLSSVVTQAERDLEGLSLELEAVKKALAAKKAEKEKLLGFVDDLTKERERLTREADRVQRVIKQKDEQYGFSPVRQADGLLPQRPGPRHHAADQDPAAFAPRADDQLQLQRGTALRPVREPATRESTRSATTRTPTARRWPRSSSRILS